MSGLIGWRGSLWRGGEGAPPSRPISPFSPVLQSGGRDETLPRQFLTAVLARAQTLIYVDALQRGEKRKIGMEREGGGEKSRSQRKS